MNGDAIKVRFHINSLIHANARMSLGVDGLTAVCIGREIDVVNRQQRFCDKDVRMAKIEIWNQCHLQSATGGRILEIEAVRRDNQLRTEKPCSLTAKLPGDIRTLRFDMLQEDPVRQKNRKPRFWLNRFRMCLVNLNCDLARFNTDVAEPPLTHKHAPWIEPGRDAVGIE